MADKCQYKVWIFAGEASGDIYGARVAEELRILADNNNCEIKIAGMGGPKMRQSGVDILVDSTELGVVGLIEVFKHIFKFIHIFFSLVFLARKERPDTIVLIDYPGFNLRFAAMMKRCNIPVIWYVSPHVWTWGKNRIPKLANYCRKMLVIFPFETEVYAPSGLPAEFVGHPLVDIVNQRRDPSIQRENDTVLILPGSRAMEINRLLLPMLKTARLLHQKHPELRFVISTPREKVQEMCLKILNHFRELYKDEQLPEISLKCGETALWLQKAGTGLAASGTITVESAIAGLPLVVAYKLNLVTLFVASMLVKLYRGYFTMVNIIANKQVFEEFLQWRASPESMAAAVERILPAGNRRQDVENDMREVTAMLSGGSSGACAKAAGACFNFITQQNEARILSLAKDGIKPQGNI